MGRSILNRMRDCFGGKDWIWIGYYARKHQSLNYKTPVEIYFGKEENST
jgi:hypothetical protein